MNLFKKQLIMISSNDFFKGINLKYHFKKNYFNLYFLIKMSFDINIIKINLYKVNF